MLPTRRYSSCYRLLSPIEIYSWILPVCMLIRRFPRLSCRTSNNLLIVTSWLSAFYESKLSPAILYGLFICPFFIAFSIYPSCHSQPKKGKERLSISNQMPYPFTWNSFFFPIYYPFPSHFLNEIGSWPLNRRARLPFRIFIVIPDLDFFSNIIERIKYTGEWWKKKMLNADVGAIARSHFIRNKRMEIVR